MGADFNVKRKMRPSPSLSVVYTSLWMICCRCLKGQYEEIQTQYFTRIIEKVWVMS